VVAPELSNKLNETVPLPLPDPDEIVIHEAVVVAIHAHPLTTVTPNDPAPVDAGKMLLVEVNE
jgi:hypothetical protein